MEFARRFWSHVTVRGPDSCWEWNAARTSDDYGYLRVGGRAGRTTRATHVALRLAFRPLQEGQVARHTCDNPPCVNPAHLIAGTRSDNHRDMEERRRHRWPQKFSHEQVAEMRRLADNGVSSYKIAPMFGASASHVRAIIGGRERLVPNG